MLEERLLTSPTDGLPSVQLSNTPGRPIARVKKRVTFLDPLETTNPFESIDGREGFKSTDEAFAPELRDKKIEYRKPSLGGGKKAFLPKSGNLVELNYDDTLRRVSVVVQQHVDRGERQKRRDEEKIRRAQVELAQSAQVPSGVGNAKTGINEGGKKWDLDDDASLAREYALQATADFNEVLYCEPKWQYSFVETSNLFVTSFALQKIDPIYEVPNTDKIYQFLKNIFVKCQLSAECSVVCLVYVERLMETAGIDLLSNNWRPIMLCGLLLASKVWQDLNCWNVEFASVLPDFPLRSINKLERAFLKYLRYSLFISGSVYAKYYFALRSLGEKKNFRNKYNTVVMTANRMIPSQGNKDVEERSAAAREAQADNYGRSV